MGGTTGKVLKTRGLLLAAAGAGVLALSGCSPRSVYTDGYTAYYEGDYRTAMTKFSALARQGDKRAQSVLWQMCADLRGGYDGSDVAANRAASAQWYRDTCDQAAQADGSPRTGVLYFPPVPPTG